MLTRICHIKHSIYRKLAGVKLGGLRSLAYRDAKSTDCAAEPMRVILRGGILTGG